MVGPAPLAANVGIQQLYSCVVWMTYWDRSWSYWNVPPPQCHHVSFVDFVVLPPGHGRSVTDFWGWDAHEAQLHCPDDVWVVVEEDIVPGGALNLKSTNLPRPWSPWESSPSRKIPTVEPRIEPGTSWLVVRDSDHYTTRLVSYWNVCTIIIVSMEVTFCFAFMCKICKNSQSWGVTQWSSGVPSQLPKLYSSSATPRWVVCQPSPILHDNYFV